MVAWLASMLKLDQLMMALSLDWLITVWFGFAWLIVAVPATTVPPVGLARTADELTATPAQRALCRMRRNAVERRSSAVAARHLLPWGGRERSLLAWPVMFLPPCAPAFRRR